MPNTNAIRTFIAIDLPEWVHNRLAEVIKLLKKPGPIAVRWVPPQNIHLTLKFLGEISPANVEIISQLMDIEAKRTQPFEIRFGGLGAFPNLNRPRVIWIGVQAPPDLENLQSRIEAQTRRLNFPAEERRFSPHLTLGRVPPDTPREDIQHIADLITKTQLRELGKLTVERVTLFRSDLKPSGAIYTTLFSSDFKRGET